jgi:hypothetical protein
VVCSRRTAGSGRSDSRPLIQAVQQLGGQAGLPDARGAVDGDEPAGALALGGLELVAKERELVSAADERSVEAACDRRCAGDGRDDAVRVDRQALALGCDRLHRLELGCVLDEAPRRVADQDLVGARCLLEPLRRVDGVAGDERRRAVPVITCRC